MEATRKIIVRPTDKFLELEFALLDFDTPERHQYAYKIQGYSNKWTYVKENYIRITTLPYGEYELKIKGKSRNKSW